MVDVPQLALVTPPTGMGMTNSVGTQIDQQQNSLIKIKANEYQLS
jgi:hypothetical protein